MSTLVKENLDKPVREWLHTVETDYDLLFCDTGKYWAKDYERASVAWEKCHRMTYLVKALVLFKLYDGKNCIKLIIDLLDRLCVLENKDIEKELNDATLLKVYNVLKDSTYEVNEEFKKLIREYRGELRSIVFMEGFQCKSRALLCSLINVILTDAYSIDSWSEYFYGMFGYTNDIEIKMMQIIREICGNPFLVENTGD